MKKMFRQMTDFTMSKTDQTMHFGEECKYAQI